MRTWQMNSSIRAKVLLSKSTRSTTTYQNQPRLSKLPSIRARRSSKGLTSSNVSSLLRPLDMTMWRMILGSRRPKLRRKIRVMANIWELVTKLNGNKTSTSSSKTTVPKRIWTWSSNWMSSGAINLIRTIMQCKNGLRASRNKSTRTARNSMLTPYSSWITQISPWNMAPTTSVCSSHQ